MMDKCWEGKIINGRLIEGAFAQDETLTEMVIPEGVEDIGEVAFYGCVNLRNVTLPESLKIIREEAFGEAGLEAVVIPAGTERICEKAFYSCPDLAWIEVHSPDTAIEADAFGACPNLLEGYVACGYPADPMPAGYAGSGSPTRTAPPVHITDSSAIRTAPPADAVSNTAAPTAPPADAVSNTAAPTAPLAFDTNGNSVLLSPSEELLYTLLWCTCPERHTAKTAARAEDFIRENEKLVMERILKTNNTAAMNGLASRKFLRPENVSAYVDEAGARHETEIVALLLAASAGADMEETFAL